MSTTPTAPVDDRRPRGDWLGRLLTVTVVCEWLVALGATAASIYLHVQNARWVGALWRDEAHTVAAALRPSLGEVWSGLATDNFPLLFTLVARAWGWSSWGPSDDGLRALGAVIGMAILAALWSIGWRIHRSPPTIALALWAFNSVAIRFGDSVRPYGLGMLLQLLAAYFMGRLALAPSWGRFLAASLVCTLAVQCLYQNAVFVLAFGLAACAISLGSGRPLRLIPPLGAGAVAAVSLVPYVGSLWQARDWTPLMESNPDIRALAVVFQGMLGGVNREVLATVLLITLVAVATALARQFPDRGRLPPGAAGWSLYALLAGVLGALGSFVLMVAMNVQPQFWHALPVLVVLAFMCDAILGYPRWASMGRAILLVAVGLLSWNATVQGLQVQHTNVDAIARFLDNSADPDDLIIVQPWFIGVTFHRYYHGTAPWTTVPELSNIDVHRYDLVKQAMATPGVLEPVIQRISSTLAAGHRVWIVGRLLHPPPGSIHQPTPTAPLLETGWRSAPFHAMWEREIAVILSRLAQQRQLIPLESSRRVWKEEKMELRVVQGWKSR